MGTKRLNKRRAAQLRLFNVRVPLTKAKQIRLSPDAALPSKLADAALNLFRGENGTITSDVTRRNRPIRPWIHRLALNCDPPQLAPVSSPRVTPQQAVLRDFSRGSDRPQIAPRSPRPFLVYHCGPHLHAAQLRGAFAS
jgi:hypothetical protein